jgi:hypothetical protein
MNGADAVETVRLYFAVLDGPNPKTWSLYGKKFPDFMQKVCEAARPDPADVSEDLLQDYTVEIAPIWSGPNDLLKDKSLNEVVGVIIDAFPKADTQADQNEKLRMLRRHVNRLHKLNQDNARASFKRFRYQIWFMTDKSTKVAGFVENAFDAAAAIIGKDLIDHQVFKEEGWLARHLTSYVQNIYVRLGRE